MIDNKQNSVKIVEIVGVGVDSYVVTINKIASLSLLSNYLINI